MLIELEEFKINDFDNMVQTNEDQASNDNMFDGYDLI